MAGVLSGSGGEYRKIVKTADGWGAVVGFF
jgi:hypothetical protein